MGFSESSILHLMMEDWPETYGEAGLRAELLASSAKESRRLAQHLSGLEQSDKN